MSVSIGVFVINKMNGLEQVKLACVRRDRGQGSVYTSDFTIRFCSAFKQFINLPLAPEKVVVYKIRL